METKILLDPSLLLTKNNFKNTFDYARAYSKRYEGFRFYYPSSLLDLITREWVKPDETDIKFFLQKAEPVELKVLRSFFETHSDVIHAFSPTPENISKYSSKYEALWEELDYRGELPDKQDRHLCNILFEQLIFLEEESWMVSRIKKTFNRFIATGTVCVQYSRRAVDTLIYRTIRKSKEQNEILSNVDRLRALGKWIAVGGSSASSLINPAVAAVLVPAALGYFMLFDPETHP